MSMPWLEDFTKRFNQKQEEAATTEQQENLEHHWEAMLDAHYDEIEGNDEEGLHGRGNWEFEPEEVDERND